MHALRNRIHIGIVIFNDMIQPYNHYLQPFIDTLMGGEVKHLKQISEELATFFNLQDDDLAEMEAKEKQSRHYERVYWAGSITFRAGLTRRPKHGFYQITDFGREFMEKWGPINVAKLKANIPGFDDPKPKKQKSKNAEVIGNSHIIKGKKMEDWLYGELTKQLSTEEDFEIEQGVRWGPSSDHAAFDITVRKNGYLTTVFEVKGDSKAAEMAGVIMPYYVFNHTPASLCIVYNNENQTFYLYNRKQIGRGDWNMVDYDGEFNHENKDRCASVLIISNLHEVAQRIKEASERQIEGFKSRPDKNVDDKLGLHFTDDGFLNPEWCRVQLENFIGYEVCRFSSLDSLFSSLKYGTFRMNGLPGMNDKDEGLFAWNMINNPKKLPTDTGKERQELNNNVFIISYSDASKADDLSMWRLYGDDSRGVCCVYSVLKDKVKDRFFLHKVKYIVPPSEREEPQDALLAKLMRYVNQQSDKKNLDFSPIIFFYKHKDYKLEEEVRLLVDNKESTAYQGPKFKREWLLTNSNNIPNPYIDIEMDLFPLKLERIILGPNMNDIDTIQVQLETMLKEVGIEAVVELSEKTSYRNTTNK